MTEHTSDCALHNAPALPAGPCDCEGGLPSGLTRLVRVGRAHVRLEDDGLEADLEVTNGEFLQPEHSPVTLYAVVPAKEEPTDVWHLEVSGMVRGPALYEGQDEWVRKEDYEAALARADVRLQDMLAAAKAVLTGVDRSGSRLHLGNEGEPDTWVDYQEVNMAALDLLQNTAAKYKP